MKLAEVDGVTAAYGSIKALKGVSFTVEGGAVGLLGPNGAGKSTLLKILLGFVRPIQGRVAIQGNPMPAGRIRARRFLGYMPERPVVSPRVSAVSFLTYCGRLNGMTFADAMERAHEALNYVGMGDNRYRKMETYSTGMCQRVKFAQALIHDPKLLLLDEPTNGLDPDGRVEMLELIREQAAKRNMAVLLSSHLMPDVTEVCERVIVINEGRIVRDAAIEELTARREGLVELRIRGPLQAYAAALRQAGCDVQAKSSGELLVRHPGGFENRTYFEIARAHDTQVRHLKPVKRRLEEVFMEAVGDSPAKEV